MKYICDYCNVFVFDSVKGERRANLNPNTLIEEIPDDWHCPVCKQPKSFLNEIDDSKFNEKKLKYDEMFPLEKSLKKDIEYYRTIAREKLAGICSVNKVCDGNPNRTCQGMKFGSAIGFGGAGQGKTFDSNFMVLSKFKFRMKVIGEHFEPDLKTELFEAKIKMPVLVSSVSGVKISMNDVISEKEFQKGMLQGAKDYGTIGLSGNTVDEPHHPGVDIIKELGGFGIPIFKPQKQDVLLDMFKKAQQAIAIGVDLDGFGSKNWELRGKPVFRKSELELKELVDSVEKPVIFKGIMTLEDAEKVLDSGAKAICVSNHGGRVLDYGQGVAEVLPEIADALKGKITIMADGAVRSGYDVLKLLALGADIALMGRPLARMSLAGGANAVKLYLEYVEKDLKAAMLMTDCKNLKDIKKGILVET